jgi:hypothetical protein
MAKVLIWYLVSPVHVRNVQLLAPELDDWEIRLVCDADSPWLSDGNADGLPMVSFAPNVFPAGFWQGDVGAVIFSAIQPRKGPIALVQAALEKGIPTVAIEESNQIALNQGSINNYVLPVDRVLTASEHERRGMIAAGFPEERFEAVGWPFYGGRTCKVDQGQKQERKMALGLDPNRPVAALTLTGLHDAGESPEVRKRQLSLSSQGLPDEYQLVIKPHPIEKLETLMPFVEECAPRATVVEGRIRIEELLEASDVLLNRGASQVCFEALFQEIPVVVLDTGIRTPLHIVEERVVTDAEALGRIIRELENDGNWLEVYEPFFKEHVPHTPTQARSLVCARITEIAKLGRQVDGAEQFFALALYQAWAGECGVAERLLARPELRSALCPTGELRRLVALGAERNDLQVLKVYFGSGFHSHLLRSLWIDQLVLRGVDPLEGDCKWMDDFPPVLQPVWFMQRIRAWVFYLAKKGHRAQAREFVDRMHRDLVHVPGVERLKPDIDRYFGSIFGRVQVALKDRCIRWLGPLREKLALWR